MKEKQYSPKAYQKIWISNKRCKDREAKAKGYIAEIRQLGFRLWHLYKK